jgi:hypothetical protein
MTITGPSLHLWWVELGCKDGTPYPMIWRSTRGAILGAEFEDFRSLCGGTPQVPESGFRTQEWNRRIGGIGKSQHVEGRAIDLLTPPWLTLPQFWDLARAHAKRPGSRTRGIGLYPWGVHLDIRPSIRLITWYGTRPDADILDSE